MMGNVSSYQKDGYNVIFDCENGRVRLSFLTETMVRVHMAPAGKGAIRETIFKCSEDKTEIEVSISTSNVAYELWVHYAKKPASVVVDSKQLPKMKDQSCYDAAKGGWYYGPGCFYGSDRIRTVNIKIPKSSKSHIIRITK